MPRPSLQIAQTDLNVKVAVLETTVINVQESIHELKDNIKDVQHSMKEDAENVMEKLSEMTKEANDQHNGILERMNQMDKRINGRISVLEKWKWLVLGGAILAGWLVSSLPIIMQIIS